MKLPLKNKLKLKSITESDILLIGTYISQNQCFIKVLRFETETGWKPFEIMIDNDEIITIPESNISIAEYVFKTITKLEHINTDEEQKIPKTIIQTHEVSTYKNLYHNMAIVSLKELNPEYEYIFFNYIDRRQFIKRNFNINVLNAYDTLVPGAFQADLFRYCYLYIHGGCYFDYKIISRIPLRNIINKNDKCLVCIDYDKQNSIDRINGVYGYLNSVIMCTPGNNGFLKLIESCVDNILNKQQYFTDSIRKYGQKDILLLTGPTLMYNILKTEMSNENLRFKHIIQNNDTSYYKNYQIVDIDTHNILFTKIYKNWKENNYYTELWIKSEIFYQNRLDILNLIIYVYPHPFPDTFKFLINKNNLYTERTDVNEPWGLNLKIKLIDDNNSITDMITIGQNCCIPLQNIKPTLFSNVFFSNDIKDFNLNIDINDNIIAITDEIVGEVLDIRNSIENSIIILTTISTNFEYIKKYSSIVDYIILYISTDCYYFCFEKNLKYIYMTLHISKLLRNKTFKGFKHLRNNVSLKLISRTNLNKYINNCKLFLKTYTKDDNVLIQLNENLCFYDNIISLYNNEILKYEYILLTLNNIIYNSGEKLEGNLFYAHNSFGEYKICSEFQNKRYNLFYYSRQAYNILEIGFNGGHSTFIYLISNPYSKIQLFDIGEHSYSKLCFEYLDSLFPERINIVWGDSTKTLETYKTNIKYDLIHIDGGHTRYIAESDFYNCKELCDDDSLVLIDDTQCEPLLSLFNNIIKYDIATKEKLEYETDHHMLLKIKH